MDKQQILIVDDEEINRAILMSTRSLKPGTVMRLRHSWKQMIILY